MGNCKERVNGMRGSRKHDMVCKAGLMVKNRMKSIYRAGMNLRAFPMRHPITALEC